MDWLNGPLSDHAVWIAGFHVFAWKRVFTLAQLLLAGVILLTLLDVGPKQRLAARLKEWAVASRTIKIRSGIRFRAVAGWAAFCIALISLGVSMAIGLPKGWMLSEIVRSWIVCFVLLSVIILPLALYVGALIHSVIVGWYLTKRIGPPILAWLFHHERFDRSVSILSFLGLVVVTLGQLSIS